jgi:D-alanyl-D-alanine carboxypeptidase
MKNYENLVMLVILNCFFVIKTNSNAEQFIGWHQEITSEVKAQMIYSWQENSPVPLSDLRYISVSHWDFNGNVQQGELVMHKKVADDIIDIFRKLFAIKFPIQSMKLIDHFQADDERSMAANNCSAHCTRRVVGTSRWSNHSYGTAIDINPRLNPYTRDDSYCPQNSKRYLDRTLNEPGMITHESTIYHIFKEKGWEWGGECFDHCVDYHHFQKVVPGLNKSKNNSKFRNLHAQCGDGLTILLVIVGLDIAHKSQVQLQTFLNQPAWQFLLPYKSFLQVRLEK